MTNDENDCITLKVSVLRSNFRRLEGVALLNGESKTASVNRALAFYEAVCTTPPGRGLTWYDANGDRYMIIVVDPADLEDSLNPLIRWWRATFGRVLRIG